ncbi:MAG: hypothetical protein UV38_C0003G0109 [candidate division TM6 bacterium GW2011_GWE2_42_60]|nr:MAG: hypothetical protein UV38_C0003G0109 [candidate division TM6 bacterium GW2011_GWE2_42_60]HBY05412.1 hypothetical protein [Candidatus Dependentiae bacterium]
MKKVLSLILPVVLFCGLRADDQVAPEAKSEQPVDQTAVKFLNTLKETYDSLNFHEKIQQALQAAADKDPQMKKEMLEKYGEKLQDGTVVLGIPSWFLIK